TFTQQLFSEATVQFAIDNGVNVVFLLSVLHHVIVAKGLEWARTALTRLLDNKITIIAELAKKEEDVPFQWKDHLPTNELEAFGGHGYRAIEIDKFPALNGKVIRSLYCVQQNILKYEPIDLEHSDEPEFLSHEDITFSSVSNAAVPEKQYVRSRDKFGKIFRLGAARDRELLAQGLSSELSIGPQLASMAIAPRVLGT